MMSGENVLREASELVKTYISVHPEATQAAIVEFLEIIHTKLKELNQR